VSYSFELCDIDQWNIPYPDGYFDFIHARSIHIGVESSLPLHVLFASQLNSICQIHNYPRFLHEIARLLRPGGLVLLVEPTLHPCPPPPSYEPMRGWVAFWDTYRACLTRQLIDVTVPERLADLLASTSAFERIIVQEGNIPVGFWPQGMILITSYFNFFPAYPKSPKDPHLLTVGQLQWMDYELFLPALRPLFLSCGLPPSTVEMLIRDAQHDLYHPSYPASTLLHIAYASRRYH